MDLDGIQALLEASKGNPDKLIERVRKRESLNNDEIDYIVVAIKKIKKLKPGKEADKDKQRKKSIDLLMAFEWYKIIKNETNHEAIYSFIAEKTKSTYGSVKTEISKARNLKKIATEIFQLNLYIESLHNLKSLGKDIEDIEFLKPEILK